MRLVSDLTCASPAGSWTGSPFDDVLDLEATSSLDQGVGLYEVDSLAKLSLGVLNQLLPPDGQRLEQLLDDDRGSLRPSCLAADAALAARRERKIGARWCSLGCSSDDG